MKRAHVEEMVRGWFVGNFAPAVLRSEAVEVGIKSYREGDQEPLHYHKVATELTAIVSGRVRMFGAEWGPGDIVTVEPGDETDFLALTDAVTVVVKVPSVADDKYLVATPSTDAAHAEVMPA